MTDVVSYNPSRKEFVDFKPLPFKVKGKIDCNEGYKIYTEPTKFIFVKAKTIAQALRKCGIAHPIKIVRVGAANGWFFNKNKLKEVEDEYNTLNPKPEIAIENTKPIPIQETL